jgi:putative hydrolase of the HAD superfamily
MTVEVVLFDVFGTLVGYEADVARLPYPATHELVRSWGWDGSHDDFVHTWSTVSARFEDVAAVDHREYGMLDVAAAALPSLSDEQRARLVASFLAEWQLGVRPIDGVPAMLRRLAARCRLGVVSNTHDPDLVPTLLEGLGVLDAFEVLVLSVDHGHRKPHPSIYTAALDAFGCAPADAAFVGDTVAADYEGPTAAGMTAYLIDPARAAAVPSDRRLDRVTDLEPALRRAFPSTFRENDAHGAVFAES